LKDKKCLTRIGRIVKHGADDIEVEDDELFEDFSYEILSVKLGMGYKE